MGVTRAAACMLLLSAHGCAGKLLLARDESLSFKERPVMKIVRLLKDMRADLQKGLDDDKAVHAMLSCWCDNNDKEKTAAIDMAQQQIEQLKSSMSEAEAKIYELRQKRKSTQEQMYADQKALDTATALRMKENQAYQAASNDLQEAVQAASQAIVVLSKHHPELQELRSVVRQLQDTRMARILPSAGLRRDQMEALKGFLSNAESASSFLAIPGFKSYRPQSGQVYGILKQMKEDFEANLDAETKAEMKAKTEFDELKAAKLDEINAAAKAIEEMDVELADTSEKHAQAAQELEDTEKQLGLDQEFLANLKRKCSESAEEFDARTKSRNEEIVAVDETIAILNSDTAFDNFDKTVNSGAAFVQTSSASSDDQQRRKQLLTVLKRAADRSGAPELMMLATSAQLDAFTKVKAAIDTMVAELTQQQADEVKHRDWCVAETALNERDTAAADDKKEALQNKIADLEKEIESMTTEIETSKAAIAEMQVQMKRASEVREAENADYQETVVDHRLTQQILQKALARMKQVYAMMLQQKEEPEQPGAPHIQTSGTHTDPGNGPARFTEYGQHSGGGKVIQMLEKVFADSRKTEDEAIAAEQDGQTAYESFMKDSNKGIKAAQTKINNLVGAKAKAKESISMADSDLKSTLDKLEGLNNVLGDLRKSCDFVVKNFDDRQAARTAEIDALKEAKAILSGMK